MKHVIVEHLASIRLSSRAAALVSIASVGRIAIRRYGKIAANM